MSSSYTITEPHPTAPQNTYMHSGRGGAGNFFRAPRTTSPSGVPMHATSTNSAPSTGRFYSGRGGAGNAHPASERPVLSFDEEYARAETREKVSQGHVGRGGAGNVFAPTAAEAEPKERKQSTSSSRRDSSSTTGSSKAGFWARLSVASLGSH